MLGQLGGTSSPDVVVVDVKHSQILFVFEAFSDRGGTCVADVVVIQEEHVQPHVGSQSFADFGHHDVIDLIFAQVNCLQRLGDKNLTLSSFL